MVLAPNRPIILALARSRPIIILAPARSRPTTLAPAHSQLKTPVPGRRRPTILALTQLSSPRNLERRTASLNQ